MTEFSVKTEKIRPDVALIYLSGYLDAHTFEEFDEIINDLFEEGVYRIIVDLNGLEYISSAGAGVFIGALSVSQEHNGNIVITGMTENVCEVFELLGLVQIFSIVADANEALATFDQ